LFDLAKQFDEIPDPHIGNRRRLIWSRACSQGIHIDTFWTAFVFAVVLAILNIFVKPLLILLTLPVTIITLGLFLFVINALVVLLASRFVDGISVAGFWWALIFSLILSVVTSILDNEFNKERRRSIL
jgi:putative membrane protein